MNNREDILQFGMAVVTSNGLNFHQRFYTNSSMVKNKWFELAAREGEWLIPVLYTPSNHEFIILFDAEKQEIATTVDVESRIPNNELSEYFGLMQSLKDRFFKERSN